MAVQTRSVTRREPIVITVDTGGKEPLTFEAHPLPWRKRNDLGELLLQSYSNTLNQLVAGAQSGDGIASMSVGLFEQGLDYLGLFAIAYPNVKESALDALDFDQMVEVLSAALEVNGFDRLVHMLDPDRKKGPTTGENETPTEATTDAGPKTE